MTKRDGTAGAGRKSEEAGRPLGAQVIVRSASGKRLRPDVPITTRNLADYTPAPEDAEAARRAFRDAGFEVGELVGISFSITAPRPRFEEVFGIRLRVDERGAVAAASGEVPRGGLELPLERLPRSLAERLVAVAFTPPAELHDGEGSALF